jgi:hypothetical protein
MTSSEIHDFQEQLRVLISHYEEYRMAQEKEHALLSRRGPINEWNILVRQKNDSRRQADLIEKRLAGARKRWLELGDLRRNPEFSAIRELLASLQALVTRILTCDRMNETLLYHGGYLQSVVAYRSAGGEG